MILTVKGEWETKGNPPPAIKRLPKWLWRMFYWDKKGSFERTIYFEDTTLAEFGTPVGNLAVAIQDGRLVVVLTGIAELVDIDLSNGSIPFSWSVSGQSIRGIVGLQK